MYSTVERRDGCEYSNSTLEGMHSWNQLFLKINILMLKELLKQWMSKSSPVKMNTVPFEEWVTAILSVTKTDTLLQGMDGCN